MAFYVSYLTPEGRRMVHDHPFDSRKRAARYADIYCSDKPQVRILSDAAEKAKKDDPEPKPVMD